MSYSNNDILRFSNIFKGNEEAYGVTVVGEMKDGKAEANSRLMHATLTPAIYARHLNGEISIGVAPITENSTCYFGAIDIDDYKYNIMDVVAAIEDFNMPLVPCFSKSKKLHLYIFFSDPVPAEDVIKLLKWYARAFACDKKVEIFPKQSKSSSTNTFYSWINIPYFNVNDETNHRRIVRKDGSYITSLPEALDVMEEKQLSYEEHQEWIESFEYHDAPPCILSGILLRDIGPGQRNNWLFSVGVFLRLKDENCDLRSLLLDVNHSLQNPIPDGELEATVIKGFSRKTYFYMCAALDRCDKAVCRQQEFGIESKSSTGLDFGELTQYMTDPPYYEWIVNGQKLTFWNEQEIIAQAKFRALCLRQLHLVPRRVKDDIWAKILTRACENIKVIDQDADTGDFTAGSTFFDLTCRFFNTKRKAENITQIHMGRVYVDSSANEYVFTAKSFMDFLTTKNDFKTYQPVEVRVRLQQLGAHKDNNMWRIPISSIPVTTDQRPEVDFRDVASDEPF